MKKFYLHLQDQHGTSTKVIRLNEDGCQLRTLQECTINAFPHVKGQALQAYTLVHEERKKPLPLDECTAKVKHLDDVFLELIPQHSNNASTAPTTQSTPPADPAAARPLLAYAASAIQASNFQLAAELYEQCRRRGATFRAVSVSVSAQAPQHLKIPNHEANTANVHAAATLNSNNLNAGFVFSADSCFRN
eukprot:4207-Pelagomonas_calceolata.AAC.1